MAGVGTSFKWKGRPMEVFWAKSPMQKSAAGTSSGAAARPPGSPRASSHSNPRKGAPPAPAGPAAGGEPPRSGLAPSGGTGTAGGQGRVLAPWSGLWTKRAAGSPRPSQSYASWNETGRDPGPTRDEPPPPSVSSRSPGSTRLSPHLHAKVLLALGSRRLKAAGQILELRRQKRQVLLRQVLVAEETSRALLRKCQRY